MRSHFEQKSHGLTCWQSTSSYSVFAWMLMNRFLPHALCSLVFIAPLPGTPLDKLAINSVYIHHLTFLISCLASSHTFQHSSCCPSTGSLVALRLVLMKSFLALFSWILVKFSWKLVNSLVNLCREFSWKLVKFSSELVPCPQCTAGGHPGWARHRQLEQSLYWPTRCSITPFCW